mgnify:CR=1 FL=1
MKEFRLLIQVLSKQKWWFIVLLFPFFIAYTFRAEIVRVVDLKVLGKDIVISSIEKDVIINRALLSLMKDTDSDRAYIFRFHNGVQYYDGTHKSKMSCDYEVTKAGISREAQRLQDIPTALYADWIKEVISNNMYVYNVSLMEDERAKQTLEIQGIKGVAVAPYYRDGKLYALIGVDYVSTINEENLYEFERNRDHVIESFKRRVQGIGDLII